jgi:uncharacterized membrane protein
MAFEPAAEVPPAAGESGQIGQNIAAVHDFYAREEQKLSHSQRHAEQVSRFVGRPAFLRFILLFVALWTGANAALPGLGLRAFDPAPYYWLQGLIGLGALLVATVVLIKQNRVAKLGEQRAHLDLKVTLLIEQKTAKVIDLLEELRRDLPNVRDRHDPGALVMQQAIGPESVLAALDEPVTLLDGSTAAPATAAEPPAAQVSG